MGPYLHLIRQAVVFVFGSSRQQSCNCTVIYFFLAAARFLKPVFHQCFQGKYNEFVVFHVLKESEHFHGRFQVHRCKFWCHFLYTLQLVG